MSSGGRLMRNPMRRAAGKVEEAEEASSSKASDDEAGVSSEVKAEHVEALEDFAEYVTEEGLLDDVSTFLTRRMSKILPDPDSDEFGHEYARTPTPNPTIDSHVVNYSTRAFDCYQEYVALVEKGLEGFTSTIDMTPKQFQLVCMELMDTDATIVVDGTKLKAANFLRAFMASWEFDAFASMARQHAESHRSGRGAFNRARLQRTVATPEKQAHK